jgi:Zn-dependent protease
MAAAGPAGNLLLAAAAFALLKFGLLIGWFTPPEFINFQQLVAAHPGAGSTIATILSILLVLNVLLAAFNLVPLPPLDGASVIGLFLSPGGARRMRELSSTPMFQLVGLLLAWRIFPFIVRPLFSLLIRLVHPQLSYS